MLLFFFVFQSLQWNQSECNQEFCKRRVCNLQLNRTIVLLIKTIDYSHALRLFIHECTWQLFACYIRTNRLTYTLLLRTRLNVYTTQRQTGTHNLSHARSDEYWTITHCVVSIGDSGMLYPYSSQSDVHCSHKRHYYT